MAPEPVPVPKFQPLHEVLAEAYSDSPTILCAFLGSDGNACNDTVEKGDLEGAKHYVEKVSQCLSKINENSPLQDFLFQLCNYCLCSRHMEHSGHPKSQWLSELKTKRLKQKFVSLLEMNNRWPPPLRVLKFKAIQNDETWLDTPKRIDKVLKKELKGTDKNFVYLLYSPEALGKFKIGVCKDPPLQGRIKEHQRCYPKSEIIEYVQIQKHAYKVEQLMLAEFQENHVQLEEPCWGCSKEEKAVHHIEWLQVERHILVDRIDYWHEYFLNTHVPRYDKNNRFKPDKGQNTPEGAKEFTPTKSGRWSSSRSPTPCNDSPDPFSTMSKDIGKVGGKLLEELLDSTPTKNRRGSPASRSSVLTDEDQVPPSKESGGIGKANGNSPKINEDYTPTKTSRGISRRFLAPPDENTVRSRKTSEDIDSISDQSTELSENSTPTKQRRRSLRLSSSPNENSVSGPKKDKKAEDKSENSTEGEITENLSMIKLTSGYRTRRTSAMSWEGAAR